MWRLSLVKKLYGRNKNRKATLGSLSDIVGKNGRVMSDEESNAADAVPAGAFVSLPGRDNGVAGSAENQPRE